MVRPRPGPNSEPLSGHRSPAPAPARLPAAVFSSQMERLQRRPELGKLAAAGPQAGASSKAAWGWGLGDRAPFRGQHCGVLLPFLLYREIGTVETSCSVAECQS